MVNYLQSCTGVTSLEWLEVKTFSLFTTIMTTIDEEISELYYSTIDEIRELHRQLGECKVPCVVTSVYTTMLHMLK